jgi:hypothetical protein
LFEVVPLSLGKTQPIAFRLFLVGQYLRMLAREISHGIGANEGLGLQFRLPLTYHEHYFAEIRTGVSCRTLNTFFH